MRIYSPGGKFYIEDGRGPYAVDDESNYVVDPKNAWTKEYLEGLMPACPPEPKEWSELVELWKGSPPSQPPPDPQPVDAKEESEDNIGP